MTEVDIRYNILIIIGVASEQISRISWKKGSDTVMMTRLSFMLRYKYFSSSESKKYFQLPQFFLSRYSFHSPAGLAMRDLLKEAISIILSSPSK